ncbi:hypothetical protein WDV76_10245 [Xenorhabdus griffiniae]|uniref:hypothetical protein n=1 Tax=Xenorhabdus griffiniae TaxID=351672 RepID=UPI0030D005C7
MPFYQPFKTSFESGDLIFGLYDKRKQHAQKHPGFQLVLDPNNISTIDRYSITQNEIKVRKMYGQQIPHNQESFTTAVMEHWKYRDILNQEDNYKIDIRNGNVYYPRKITSRKCKAGLSWYSHSLSHANIHFILDGIDMENVINKKNNPKIDKGKDSYTNKELRWIYRNRKDPRVQSCIQFWLDGSPVSPPWIEGRYVDLWQNYQPKFENSEIELGEFAETVLNFEYRDYT